MVRVVEERALKVPGGTCGFYGACGVGVGTGIFISVVTGATPLAKENWKHANGMTGAALSAIACHGGPRCCKRTTWDALETAVVYVKEHLGITLDGKAPGNCEYSRINKECLGAQCPYHPGTRVH